MFGIGTAYPATHNLEQGIEMNSNNGRLLQSVVVDRVLIDKMMALLQLTAIGNVTVPENGRIASNICVDTKEYGNVMLRFYPPGYQGDKLETGNLDFEIEVLHYLSSNGIHVPAPLEFKSGVYKWEENGIKVFAYKLLSGKALEITDLSDDVAKGCGELLQKMVALNEAYSAAGDLPEGDLEYFLKIYQLQVERFPQLKNSDDLKEMGAFVTALIQDGSVAKTPRGIVHADFFFENILKDELDHFCAIDFGDAYYGHVIMDIAIGAMEFCVMENGTWNMEFFKSFLKPHAEWLNKNKISANLFYSIIAANCLRFAIYTMPNTLEDGLTAKENPYVVRFHQLMVKELKNSIEEAYAQSIQ